MRSLAVGEEQSSDAERRNAKSGLTSVGHPLVQADIKKDFTCTAGVLDKEVGVVGALLDRCRDAIEILALSVIELIRVYVDGNRRTSGTVSIFPESR